MTFQKLYSGLRRKNHKNYALLMLCDFISVLLITSYAVVICSPTILNMLPEGGDSRKQLYMIFALAVIGCAAFTLYAAGLFFRFKSREMGTFLALGAPKSLLRKALYQELALISVLSCAAGAVCGVPLALGIWQLFRIVLIDTADMVFHISANAFLYSAAFSAFVILALFVMAAQFIRRTNIIDIVNEQRKSEPVRCIPRWCGWAGILLSVFGGVAGYFAPNVSIRTFHYYPGAWIYMFYLPLLAGIYMILLHTVVNGWRGGKGYYKNIITHSMMKFQGRQTVNNMLVMTLLLAGAYFASFYTPTMMMSQILATNALHFDNLLHWQADQDAPTREEIFAMAAEEGVEITDYREAECVLLGGDGELTIEEGRSWHAEYREVLDGRLFFSASAFRQLTGEAPELAPGEACTFKNFDGSEPQYGDDYGLTLVTNTITGERLPVEVTCDLLYTEFGSQALILNDADYARLAAGLPDTYKERWAGFNVANVDGSYRFSRRLYDEFLSRMGPETYHSKSWNLVAKEAREKEDGEYYIEQWEGDSFSFEKRHSVSFRLDAKYKPLSRIMERADKLQMMAVFVTVFLYIAVVCYLSVILIGYTRCKSIALNNRQVYEDLRRLGADRGYLFHSVRGQVSKVYLIPAAVGTSAIYALYSMILFSNDGRLASGEIAALLACAAILAALSAVLWACYRYTLKSVCKTLDI